MGFVTSSTFELPNCQLNGDIDTFIYDVKKSINIFFQQVQDRLDAHEQFEGVWRENTYLISEAFKEQIFGRQIMPRVFSSLGDYLEGCDYEWQNELFRVDILSFEGNVEPGITQINERTFDIDGYFTLTLPFDVPEDITSLQIQFEDFDTESPNIYVECSMETADDKDTSEEEEQVDLEIVEELFHRPPEEHDAIILYAAGQNILRVGLGLQPATLRDDTRLIDKITEFPIEVFEITYTPSGEQEEKTELCVYNSNLTTEQELEAHLTGEKEVTATGFGGFFGYPDYAVTNFQQLRDEGVFVATHYLIEYYYAYLEGRISKELFEATRILPFTVKLENAERAEPQAKEYINTLKEFTENYKFEYEYPEFVPSSELSTELSEILPGFTYYDVD